MYRQKNTGNEIEDEIEQCRSILKQWDDGLLSVGECECRIHDLFLDPFFKAIEDGEEYIRFGSCCCSSHPPDRTFVVKFTIQPHGFVAKKLDINCDE